jgi:hypothetical protein
LVYKFFYETAFFFFPKYILISTNFRFQTENSRFLIKIKLENYMEISNRILSDITVYMKYARFIPELNRRETWEELVTRNKQMHQKKYPQLHDEIENVYKFVYDKKVLPSMRSLQFGGKPIEISPNRIYNCAYAPIDDWRVFGEVMFLLLGGTGVGYSVQKHHVEKLPEIRKPKQDRERRFLVSDSIEGWADTIKAIIKSYFTGGSSLRFDYSDIRPKGSRLITSGGKAPGPEPLRICVEKIRSILDLKKDGDKLTPIEVHDIVCHIADAVLAGGIRRAALISLFSADDDEMISCKFGSWWELNPQRGRANNSAVLLRSKVSEEFFKELWKKIELSNAGEPGIYFSNDKDWGTNPSLRAGTKVLTTDGVFPIEQLDGKEFFVKNLNGEVSKAKCWLSGKNKQLYKITLTGNHTYYATPEHEWPVWNGTEYVKVRSEDLSAGNMLPIIRENSLFDGGLGNYNDGFFIGWHLGDGWTSIRKDGGVVHGMVVSHTESEYVKDKLEEYLSTELQSSAKFSFKDNGTFELNTTLNSWNELQEKFGYGKKENGLPIAVWESGSEEFRKGIIDGLFSSDGHVCHNRVTLTTKHEKMANDVSELLGFYGIKTVIRKSNSILNENVYTRFDVTIKEKHSILHFRDVFKLTNSKKQEVLDSIEYKYSIPDLKQIEIIDVELSDVTEDVWDISVYDETHCFQIAHAITGNCCEIALRPFQFCNLCEVNVSDVVDQADLEARVKAATFIGTLQAGYTDFHYLRPIWQRTTEKDALLGVGMTGIGSGAVQKLDVKSAAKIAKEENERLSEILGINKAARVTTIKPAGTSSLTLGCSSGIHAWHNDYYLRRIRVGKNEAIYDYLAQKHPQLVENEYFRPHDTAVIGIPQKAPEGSILRTESPLQLLERVKWFNSQWIRPGHRNGMNTHNISATVSIRENEWPAVGEWLWSSRDSYNGISVLPFDDHSYTQAPFEDITEEKYHQLMETLKDVNLSEIVEMEDETNLTGEIACGASGCEIK